MSIQNVASLLLPEFRTLPQKHLTGKRLAMSLSANRTTELWKSFMTERDQISDRIGDIYYSVEKYPAGYFEKFNPSLEFEKWAAVEVSGKATVPEGMEELILEKSDYVVFLYRGEAKAAPQAFMYIFNEWFPASAYEVADRPHLGVMGKKYRNEGPDSEEEFWIPINPKTKQLS